MHQTRQETINCNTVPCPPTWSNWFIVSNTLLDWCSAPCGGGTAEERSNCFVAEEMLLSTLCEGAL